MDNFINLAKQGYEAYQSSQGQGQGRGSSGGDPSYHKTGGEEYNAPHHSQQGGGYGGYYNINHEEAVSAAHGHAEGSGDPSLFSGALSYVHQNQGQHNEEVDEDAVQEAHRQAYQRGSGSSMPASSLGSAAALQALQHFTSGGGGGGSQTQLISMAMAEASKLFDQSGGASSGGKQDAVNGAAMTVVKLLVKSKFSGGPIGGGNSGGLGGLAGLATKFL